MAGRNKRAANRALAQIRFETLSPEMVKAIGEKLSALIFDQKLKNRLFPLPIDQLGLRDEAKTCSFNLFVVK